MITEISKAKTLFFSSLSNKKQREKNQLFVAEGEKLIHDIINNFIPVALISTTQWIEKYNNESTLLKNIDENILYQASPQNINKISSLSTAPEIIGIFKMPERKDKENLILETGKLYLALDEIQDPGNLGTIIRTADWFGINTIYASHGTVDIFNPKTVQATMGSMSRVKVIYCDLINLIKQNPNIPIYGTMLPGEDIYITKLSPFGLVIMGNEGNGLSDKIKNIITKPLYIPPTNEKNHPESLNVGIATGIILSVFRHQKMLLS